MIMLPHRSGLKAEEVDYVELLGGGTRVPRLQAALTEVLGGRTLDRHLDADEAVRCVILSFGWCRTWTDERRS